MPPKDYISTLTMMQDWINSEINKKHSMAARYIEENVDLIDTDLQKFMDDCPSSCRVQVYDMLLKAGIDMKGYVMTGILKQWSNYIHDYNSQFHKYEYTIDYKKELNDYVEKTIAYKPQYIYDSIVLDTIPVVNER